MDWNSAKTACDELILNGYSDWHFPTKEEFNAIYLNLAKLGGGGFADDRYWRSAEYKYGNAWILYFFYGIQYSYYFDTSTYNVRAIRAF